MVKQKVIFYADKIALDAETALKIWKMSKPSFRSEFIHRGHIFVDFAENAIFSMNEMDQSLFQSIQSFKSEHDLKSHFVDR